MAAGQLGARSQLLLPSSKKGVRTGRGFGPCPSQGIENEH